MDALIHSLQERLREHPQNVTLQATLSTLASLKDGVEPPPETWSDLRKNLISLRDEGIWVPTQSEAASLKELQQILAQSHPSVSDSGKQSSTIELGTNQSASGHSTVQPVTAYPEQASPRLPFSFATPTALPMELYNVLNQAYYLHILATEPQNILPPGKSLLSVLARPHAERHTTSALHERVEDIVHRAFWDEALDALSNPSPPVQLTRLKRLYEDLHAALSPLLPAGHPVLFTLSSPLSPTSSPLHSTVIHLREVLDSLKKRCAPARDPEIDVLSQKLEDPPDASLARVIVDVVRSLLKLAEEMKDDLSQFVLGAMSEQQLRSIIAQQASGRERELILQLWPIKSVRELWNQWLDEFRGPSETASDPSKHATHDKFIRRLLSALGAHHAVSCNLPTVAVDMSPSGPLQPSSTTATTDTPPTPPNSLPPPLLFITPTLFHIQNYLQALVIAASLRALVRIPTTPAKRKIDADEDDLSEHGFLRRIWTLLKADIDGEPAESGLKLVNLADEVVRIGAQYGCTLDGDAGARDAAAQAEARLRDAVDRTLKPTDPVFLLLQKRLVDVLAVHLVQHTPVVEGPAVRPSVPRDMRTGRQPKNARKMRNGFLGEQDGDVQGPQLEFARETIVVKGFDQPVLKDAISDVILKLRKCIAWTELVWADLFEQP